MNYSSNINDLINNEPLSVQTTSWHEREHVIIGTGDGLVYWPVYALIGRGELKALYHFEMTQAATQSTYCIKFQRSWKNLNSDLTALGLCEILPQTSICLVSKSQGM